MRSRGGVKHQHPFAGCRTGRMLWRGGSVCWRCNDLNFLYKTASIFLSVVCCSLFAAMFPSCCSKTSDSSGKRSSIAKLLLGVFVVYMLHTAWLLYGFLNTKPCDGASGEQCIPSYLTARPRLQVSQASFLTPSFSLQIDKTPYTVRSSSTNYSILTYVDRRLLHIHTCICPAWQILFAC